MTIKVKNKQTGALLSMLLIVIIWGSASAVTKVAVDNIPPFLFAFLRKLVAVIILLSIYIYQRKTNPAPIVKPPLRKLVWMGLTGVTLFYLFFNLSLFYTTATAGALIQGFIPASIILLAILILKERLAGLQWVGVLLSVAGVVLIGFVGKDETARNSLLGNALMIVAVLSWGYYTILSKGMSAYDTMYVITISTCIGTALLIPPMIFEFVQHPVIPSIPLKGWLSVIYLGAFSSALCYILYNRVVKVLSGVQVGNLMNLDPVAGATIAVLALGERLTALQIAGGVLILAGVVLTSRNGNAH